MIFSRRRAGTKRDAETVGSESALAPTDEALVDSADSESDESQTGPFDIANAPAQEKVLDLGALRIPMVDGVEVRVQADPEGRVQQIALVAGDNALQLSVLAAPRTEQIWDEVRSGIRSQLRSDGFASQEVDGSYGTELRTRVRTPNGPTDLRFVGVSGPRWLVRGIFQGPVALDTGKAPLLLTCFQGLVVDRGAEAMPAGEPMPLQLPKELANKASGSKVEPPKGRAPWGGTRSTARRRRPPKESR